jgi:transcriptional regulator GlxA family with amidase domain
VLETEAFGDPAFDTVIVGSITEMEIPPSDASVIVFVREAAKASRRTASICSGAFVRAEADLLNGRRDCLFDQLQESGTDLKSDADSGDRGRRQADESWLRGRI